MSASDFSTAILVDQSPVEAFNAINNPRGWWSEEIKGSTNKLNAEFDYHYEDLHRSKMKITEMIPGQKVVWHVVENYFAFTKDKKEWTGTNIVFDISKKGDKTQIRMTHQGLTPDYECFEICQDAWSTYIQKSLRNLITTGKGEPNGKDQPRTENEKKLSKK
jgi:hypothetical protein